MWREVSSAGLMIDGHSIPIGCDIGTSAYAIHHHPLIYDRPFEYRPERWLKKQEGDSQLSDDLNAYIPFSAGSRGCIGRSLAMREMMLIAATLLLRFDFRVAEGPLGRLGEGGKNEGEGRENPNEYQLYEHVTCAKRGPYMQFVARRSSN